MEFVSTADIDQEIKADCLALHISYHEIVNVDIDKMLSDLLDIVKNPSSFILAENKHIPNSVKMLLKNAETKDEFNTAVNKIVDILDKLRVSKSPSDNEAINIPQVEELNTLKTQLNEIVLEIHKMKITKKSNHNLIITQLSEKYKNMPCSIIKILVEDPDKMQQNVLRIKDMLRMAETIKTGNISYDRANQLVEENLRSTFVYPQFGGKDKFYAKVDEIVANSEAKAAQAKAAKDK